MTEKIIKDHSTDGLITLVGGLAHRCTENTSHEAGEDKAMLGRLVLASG